jgi:DNA-directed RNA polymerase subunit RPC12/RpoP
MIIMAIYRCMSCKSEVELDLKTAKKIQCSKCGQRVLLKPRAKTVRAVKCE